MNLTIKHSHPWFRLITEAAAYETDPFPILEATVTFAGITAPFRLVSISEHMSRDMERDMEWCIDTEWKQLPPPPKTAGTT